MVRYLDFTPEQAREINNTKILVLWTRKIEFEYVVKRNSYCNPADFRIKEAPKTVTAITQESVNAILSKTTEFYALITFGLG